MKSELKSEVGGFQIRPVIYRIGHHAAWDGYDRLADFLGEPSAQIRVTALPPVTNFLMRRCFRLLFRHPALKYYNSSHWRAELQVCAASRLKCRQLFHFLYGEDQFLISGRWSNRRNIRLIATVHQPPSTVSWVLNSASHFSRIDGLILMARCQLDFWQQYLPPERLIVSPIGVDIDVFRPIPRPVVSGPHFFCLTPGDQAARFSAMENVVFLHQIPDEALRLELQQADLLLLPLIDSTANMALLAGLACGCPVLATDIGGSRDYLDDTCAFFVPPRQPAAILRTLNDIMIRPEELGSKRTAARLRALRHAWPVAAAAVAAAYAQIIALPPNL